MGFFSDLKEDLSQAVNELLPEEELTAQAQEQETAVNLEVPQEAEAADNAVKEEQTAEGEAAEVREVEEAAEADVEEADAESEEEEDNIDLESMLAQALGANLDKAEMQEDDREGAEKKMDTYERRSVSDETSVITAGMTITGDITSEGSLDVIGSINGNIDILGKLNITGHITGNSKAAEIYAESAKINGEVVSEGAVKIGASSVIIGNITATSAAIAGAVKGDIDVKGPVILDASAIVMGNIKSKSVQINNGAVIEGMCSQCYAEVSPISFFDEYRMDSKKSKQK